MVGLHDASLEPAAQQEAAATVADALKSDGRLRPLSPQELARALAGRERAVLTDAVVGPGRRLLEDGRIFHDQAQPEEAVPVLESAIVELESAMTVVDTSRDLWEALLYLGASHLALDDEPSARASWRAAVALNPDRQPDASKVPPSVVAAYRAAKAAAYEDRGGLRVRAPGARAISLNGREVGTDALQREDLVAGRHHVRALGEGALAAYSVVEVQPGQIAEVSLDLGPAPLGVPATSPFAQARQTTELYRALGVYTGTDLLLVAGGADGVGSAQLYAPSADAFSERVSFSYSGRLDRGLVGALPRVMESIDSTGRLDPSKVGPTAAPLDPSSNQYLAALLLDPVKPEPGEGKSRRRWTYVVAGAAGTLVVGGVISAFALSQGGDRGKIIVGPVP